MIKSHVFRQEADAAAGGRVSKFVTKHFTPAAAGEHESDSEMHCGGLACAVGTKKAEDFSALHAQREIAQRRYPLAAEESAVVLADIVKSKSWSAGHEWIKDITARKQSAVSNQQSAKAESAGDIFG
jgi:hypothetical protein